MHLRTWVALIAVAALAAALVLARREGGDALEALRHGGKRSEPAAASNPMATTSRSPGAGTDSRLVDSRPLRRVEAETEPTSKADGNEEVLAPVFRIRGTVVDERRRPVAGASVRLSGSEDEFLTSDDSGRYESRSATRDDVVSIEAYSPESGIGSFSGNVSIESDMVELPPIVLIAGQSIEGTILFPDGTPVAAAAVWTRVHSTEGSSDSWNPFAVDVGSGAFVAMTQAAADGTFRISGLRKGRFDVTTELGDDTIPLATVDSGTRGIRLILSERCLTVAVVWPDPKADSTPARVLTDYGSRILRPGHRGARDRSFARFPRRRGTTSLVSVSAGVPVEREVPGTDEWEQRVEIVLPGVSTARRVELRVEGPEGQEVPTFETLLFWPATRRVAGDLGLRSSGTTTVPLPEGTFDLSVIPPFALDFPERRLWIEARGTITIPPSGTVTCRIRFTRGGSFAVTPSASPAPADRTNVLVHFRRQIETAEWRSIDLETSLGCRTNFLAHGLEPGRYEARFEAEGFEATLVPFDICVGQVTEVRAEMTPAK